VHTFFIESSLVALRSCKSSELIPGFMSWYPVSLTLLIPSDWGWDWGLGSIYSPQAALMMTAHSV
jgi:hypothetical protein